MQKSKPKVFIALDVDTKEEALKLVEKWSPFISGFKVGPRLGFQFETSDWEWISGHGEVFVDYKFYDIPSTVESAVTRVFNLGASFCTVHASNGLACLKRLADLEKKLNEKRPFKILAVTLLTSFDQKTSIVPLAEGKKPKEVVNHLAQLVFESGLTGVVCSTEEVEELYKKYPQGCFVTPGIRFETDSLDDQKRVATPEAAWKKGSGYLVMGRSLIGAADAESIAKKLEQSWQSVQ